MQWLLLVLSLCAVGLFLVDAPLTLTASLPDPTKDPFYASDSDQQLHLSQPGQVLRRRRVVTSFERNVDSSSQLYYRTTSSTKEAQGTVATVWKPSKPKLPVQILSFHTYQDSASLSCHPSWALVSGTASHGKIPVSLDSSVYIQWALDRGIYVIVPDHLGPKAAWLAGIQAGAAVLDGIRALRAHFQLPMDAEAALLGYSGGAHATVWADNMASTYAPDINIIGSISGGTIFDALSAFQYIDGTIISGFAGAGLVGLMNAYPELEEYVKANFDEDGKRKLAIYSETNMCIPEVSITNVYTNFTRHFTNENPLNHPTVIKVMRQETLLRSLATLEVATPTYPRLIWHAGMDEIVPLETAQLYVEEQCANGADIHFKSVPLTTHISALVLGVPGVLDYLQRIYSHSTPQIECGSSDFEFTTLLSPLKARSLMGNDAFKFMYALYGRSLVSTSIGLVFEQIQDRQTWLWK
jgi:hypothetical protein